LGCAAIIATLEVYEEQKLLENSECMGLRLREGLLGLKQKHPCIAETRGMGLFQAVELIDKLCELEPATKYMQLAVEKGYLTLGREGFLIFAPALVITPEEIDMIVADFDDIYAQLDELVSS
jgi:4-aminobutyrate aminotransferase-like enzyme